MKRYQVFRNAFDAYMSGSVIRTDESSTSIYYNVEDPNSKKMHAVKLQIKNRVLLASCDCTNQTLNIKQLPVCSHIITALVRAMYDYGKTKKT